MRRRMIRATVVMAILLAGVMGISGLMGAMSASAEAGDSDDLEFTFLVSPGRPLVSDACDQNNATTSFANCPDMATASVSPNGITNGQSIEMKGEGTLRIDAEDGEPENVDGGGRFVHKIGGDSFGGTWEAKKLLMFETYGPPGDAFLAANPDKTAWRTGRALILVHLVDDTGTVEADAILEIGCRLPGNGGVSGTIEGIRLLISGGLNFNVAADPRATLFVDITDQEDDDD